MDCGPCTLASQEVTSGGFEHPNSVIHVLLNVSILPQYWNSENSVCPALVSSIRSMTCLSFRSSKQLPKICRKV